MKEFIWVPAVLGATAILVVAVLKLIAAAARWKILAADFPATAVPIVLAKFSNAISHVGAVRFQKAGAGNLAITDRGLLVSIANPFMADLMIPFTSIKVIRTFTFFGRTTLSLDVHHAVPMTLSLPAEAFSHLRGKVSDDVFQQGAQVASIGDLFAIGMKTSHPSPDDVATRAAPEK